MPHPKGGYKLKDGTKVPGVTTILGRFKESGALMYWACEQGKAIERGEISNMYDKRDAAAESGTLAHAMVEAHINGQAAPDITGIAENTLYEAMQGFENYLRWASDNRLKIVEQEMTLVSETHSYGGTPDAIGLDSQERLCLLDWKTSNGVYVDYIVQVAAYKILWEENNPDRPITGGVHLLRFSKETADFAHHFWNDVSDAEEQFVLLRRAYEIDKRLKKRV